nr:hypothetical protein [uncultured Mucilaginibacter sp.]
MKVFGLCISDPANIDDKEAATEKLIIDIKNAFIISVNACIIPNLHTNT